MLCTMDIPAVAGPWIVVGVVLGIGLVGLAARATAPVRRRAPSRPPEPPAAGFPEDDLPGFLESPPGSGPAAPGDGWTSLAAPSAPMPTPAPETAGSTPDRATGRTLAILATVVLLLIGASAAVAIASRSSAGPREAGAQATRQTGRTPPSSDSAAPAPDPRTAGALAGSELPVGPGGVAAELTFGGVVLEPRAVGVTATYPVLSLTASGDRGGALAHVMLPTWNCLAATAPDDPIAAGCTPTVPEYADLAAPALSVTRDGDGWRISGRFPTYVRPNGSPPVWTGRVYELLVSMQPADGRRAEGRVRAEGVLELGGNAVGTAGAPGVNVLRYGD
jgi:hypothetical protein